eukprot:7688546-Pyramimonas_sp.AAC.1
MGGRGASRQLRGASGLQRAWNVRGRRQPPRAGTRSTGCSARPCSSSVEAWLPPLAGFAAAAAPLRCWGFEPPQLIQVYFFRVSAWLSGFKFGLPSPPSGQASTVYGLRWCPISRASQWAR